MYFLWKRLRKKVEQFLKPLGIMDFTDKMSYEYAKIRKDLELAGTPIGANDLLIAAAAVHERASYYSQYG
ncbi:type II toxin-antitoxin system VapC family toxin [Treponema sp. Marseille-Q4523]|uniref:type II toxin-antitoxin system VapC family toxin n=1 Tax=Treponema sp. Marseille-Q4523 TaxID=2810610 RepID=UPI001EF58F77|nr:type II toxin-antitoxin system VapC family toxin [Treponema sp. Marseille-Q4523]